MFDHDYIILEKEYQKIAEKYNEHSQANLWALLLISHYGCPQTYEELDRFYEAVTRFYLGTYNEPGFESILTEAQLEDLINFQFIEEIKFI